MINNKVDFLMTIEVKNANPNGDPLTSNMPRIDSLGYGIISDVCIKRKIRNRMQDQFKENDLGEGYDIFVKANDRIDDDFKSLEKRYKAYFDKEKDNEIIEKSMNEKWIDVRSFGQVVTFNKKSIGIRGPVSISISKSLDPVITETMQIVRSTNGQDAGEKRSSDTMGSKNFIDYGVYLVQGSVNSFYSERTGFDEKDLEILKEALRTLFINDVSSARPDGSMEIKEIYWFTHSNKLGNVSSAKIKQLVNYDELDINNTNPFYEDYNFRLDEEKLSEYKDKGLTLEIIEGI
ncbi:MAG: type I-C CRISPR-associated protein Cas7/Csd2 [Anaerococcus sp.]|uniref:type I-C CRISPR-associated protein Cas7/Csd2 n=3 Tax=Peptoniphilaceae TaxID=1570339 RepID=UPI0029000040|nr:type I-C CRISPR-associated protein Cas7/Csd2 [Anaerococcus sp.]MDU1864210.1 type I-C CRISPR-associated protein Cas7/Csd2 [Anaerococcus sp.]MDU2354258.1 type I-C CRISPR-associated protein Cas7/Csd2 [Anaerococcus sp.]